jgi:hypothetical protein
MPRPAKKTARMRTCGRKETSANPGGGGGDPSVSADAAVGQEPVPPGKYLLFLRGNSVLVP